MNIDDDGRHEVRIAPFAARPERFLINVSRPHSEWGDGHNPATVSCFSFGGDPDEAEEYAAALTKAAEIARRLDAEYDPEKDPRVQAKREQPSS